jgi:hypothetical protein
MPIHFRADPPTASEQARVRKAGFRAVALRTVHALPEIPATARPGLWRLWVSPSGTAEGLSVDIVDQSANKGRCRKRLRTSALTVTGALNAVPCTEPSAEKRELLHLTLAAQLGVRLGTRAEGRLRQEDS